LILAWAPPGASPPASNVAAPLNVGPTGQSKEGGLILNTGGATYGLIIDQGKVGIGTTEPSEKLDVNGDIRIRGKVSCGKLYTDSSGNVLCGEDQTGGPYLQQGLYGYCYVSVSGSSQGAYEPAYLSNGECRCRSGFTLVQTGWKEGGSLAISGTDDITYYSCYKN
jgi:hypothetical protein